MELTFFTSNSVKLAHARYLSEGNPLNITGFREKTYHAGYHEPRLSDRTQLLQLSYLSAVEQAKKAGVLTPRHFFILEDTSVDIHALRQHDTEVPGLDIKYWMRGQTFKGLNKLLNAAGKNRDVTVRSHILLHLPDYYREAWKISERYLVFEGEQFGTITKREWDFETNPVFPWLDNKTFNKWFCPENENIPLGKMPIEQATKYDFRKKAFDQVINFLKKKGLLRRDPKQLNLKLSEQRNLVLCGYTCAGKTTASQQLADRYGYLHIEASDFMHLSYYSRHGVNGNVSIGDFALAALEAVPDIVARKAANYLQDFPQTPWVLSGFRSPNELEWFENEMGRRGIGFETIFINANDDVRFARMSARGRGDDEVSRNQFNRRDSQQKKMGLDIIKNASTTKTWQNVGTLDEFLRLVSNYISSETVPDFDLAERLRSITDIKNVNLEDAILISLLNHWSNAETRQYFTTSKISQISHKVFPSAPPKNKDNVSRYFNQNFRPYYEIRLDDTSGKREYRLSNTGYGKALHTLSKLNKTRE